MSEPLPPPPIDPSVGTPTAASDPSPPPPPPVASMRPWIARVNGSFPTLGHVSDQLSFVLRDTGKTDLEADCYSAHVIGSFATFDTRAGNYVIHTLPTPLDSRYSFADLRSRLARREKDGALLNVSWEDGLIYCIMDTFKDHLSLDTIQPDRGVFTATVNNDDMWGWKSSEGTPQMLVAAGMVADKIVSLSSEAEEEEPLKGTITFHDGGSTTTLDFVFDDITEKTLDELEKTYEARHAYKSALGEESGGGGQSVDAETEVPV